MPRRKRRTSNFLTDISRAKSDTQNPGLVEQRTGEGDAGAEPTKPVPVKAIPITERSPLAELDFPESVEANAKQNNGTETAAGTSLDESDPAKTRQRTMQKVTPGKQKPRGKSAPKKNEKSGHKSYRDSVLQLASLGVDCDSIAEFVDPDCRGRQLQEKFGTAITSSRREFVTIVGGAFKVLLQGRPARYDKRGRLISAEVKPNPSAILTIVKDFLSLRPPRDTQLPLKIDIAKMTDEQLAAVEDRILRFADSNTPPAAGNQPQER